MRRERGSVKFSSQTSSKMINKNILIHPNMVNNWKAKTQAKIGRMLIQIVEQNSKLKTLQVSGIVELARKFHIGDKTFRKYLKKSIFAES